MRLAVALAACVVLHSVRATDVGMNQPCNKELDGLLATDPSGNPNTFLSCVGVGVGNIGFWERKVCPNDMVFDFINQQCKTKRKKSRKQQTLNIAILNNSCANGETCIGGTVCDLDTLRCLCPYGTIPQVETLSCTKNDVTSPAFSFSSFNFENGFNQGNGDFFKPNPNGFQTSQAYKQNGFQGGSPDHGYSGSSSSWQPYTSAQNLGEFKPNQFVFNMFTTTMAPPTTGKPKVPILAYPGQSCRGNEVCSGGSICTQPIGLCLCPGELEAREGECVLPASAAIQITKVGIGALCSELAECDHGSSCIMGRCACVAPLVQHEGKCVLRQTRKEVGPGELCDNGEVCSKGSVCDSVIPVCVCPSDTDLTDGECLRRSRTQGPTPPTFPPSTIRPIQSFTQPPPTYLPSTVAPLPAQPANPFRPSPPSPISSSTINYQSINTPAYLKPTIKPNHMKINLGGSKQAGVGVRCALNTDCMIGAYCNGNTNPPSCQCLSTHVNIEGRCEKIVYPGQIGCRSDLQCSSAYTGTSCIDRVCVCPEGNRAVDQTCVPECHPACQINQSCKDGKCIPKSRTPRQASALVCFPGAQSCSNGDGVCLKGECRCLRGWQPKDGYCRPQEVPIGATCTSSDVVCQIDSVCDGGVCRCRFPGKCKSKTKARSQALCSEDSDCQENEKCLDNRCICSADTGLCPVSAPTPIVYKSLNSACWGTDRCAGGSVCKDSVCQCIDGSTELHGRCQQQPGGRCSTGQTCTSGSVCDFGLCHCLDGYILSQGTCIMQPSPPGKSCQLGQKCLHGSACRFGVCMCIGKTIALSGKCVKRQELAVKVAEVIPGDIKGPGMECGIRDMCSGGSRCRDKVCQCEEFEVIIQDQCVGSRSQAEILVDNLLVSAPGQPCEARTNCTGGSLCIDRICQCEEGKVNEEGSCRVPPSAAPPRKPTGGMLPEKGPLPGSLCTLSMECPFRTKCIKGVCRCKNGETIVDNTCRAAINQVLPGGICDPKVGNDCIGEAHCIYGICTCVRQLVNNGKFCVSPQEITIIPIGKRCTPELICAGGARCIGGYCKCASDEVPDVNGKCAKRANVYPVFNKFQGSSINQETQFKSKMDEIEELELEIKNNPLSGLAESRPNSVTLEVIYGSPCETNDDCPRDAFCQYSQCQCIPGFRASGGACERVLKAGEACSSTNQCEVNAFCLNGKCVCSSRDGKTCSAPDLRRPGEECSEGKICAFNSYCGIMSGVCECPSGMSTQDGTCQQTAAKPGMACVTSRNCHKYSYCDNGFCLCKTGYDLIEGFCVPTSGVNQFTGLPPNRNDGPQAPMQERIRTESFMKLNPVGEGVTGDGGTPYEFGPGRNSFGSQGVSSSINFGSRLPNQWSQGASTSYDAGKQNFENTQPLVIKSENFGVPQSFHKQIVTVTQGSYLQPEEETPESWGYPDEFSAPSTTSFPANNYQGNNNNNNVKVVVPPGILPDIVSYPGVTSPFVFQPFQPKPFARGSNTKNGDKEIPERNQKLTLRPPPTAKPIIRVSMPGEYCADGSICLGNSVCKGQFCRCPTGSSAENGICTQRKRFSPVNKPLNNGAIDQSEKEADRVEQRQFSSPLENCQNFEYCTAGSECLNINGMGLICQCPVGMIFMADECIDVPKKADLAGIGDPCSKGEVCLGGSSCLKEICVCSEGKREILGICVATAEPGDDCSKGEICVDGSICVGELRTCVCPPGKASKQGRCVEDLDSLATTTGSANPGEDCNSHVICMDNSFCDGLGKCTCSPKFKNVKGRCVPSSMVRAIGEACAPGTICSGGACFNSKCVCGSLQIEADGSCVEVPRRVARKPRADPCDEDKDCQFRFKCLQKVCVCEGESIDCLPFFSPNNDTECEKDENCQEKATCQEGVCICDDGFRREMNLCVARHPAVEHVPLWRQIFGRKTLTEEEMVSQEVKDKAWTHQERNSLEEESIEQSSVEQSPPRRNNRPWTPKMPVTTIPWVSATPNPQDFRPLDFGRITLSEKIQSAAKATVPFLKTKITPSKPKKTSKLTSVYVGPGASCIGKRKCSEGSICFDGYCICGYADLPINDECIPRDGMVRFGHRCTENQACIEGLVCIFNKCQCPLGDQSCNPNEPVTSPPGGSCTEARECTGGSVCREGWCICPDPTMIVQKGICIQSGPRPTLPSRTVPVYTTPSPVYHPPAVYSTPKIFNALPSPQSQSRKRTPGSQCGPLDTCVGGSTCVEGLCVCAAGMQPSLNGRCETTQSTTPAEWLLHASLSVFISSYRPRPDYIELPLAGQTTSTLGTTHATRVVLPSSSSNDCEAIGLFCRGNTICVNRSCQCPEGHILHNDGCVPPNETGKRRKVRGKARHQVVGSSQYARPGESCALGQVCTGGSVCTPPTQLCTCPVETPHIKNERCLAEIPTRRQAVAGESCDDSTDCINNSQCHAGQCRCPAQHIAISGHCLNVPQPTTPPTKVIAKPLESCDDGEICSGGSKCDADTGYCLCPMGQVAFGEKCMSPPTAAPTTRTTRQIQTQAPTTPATTIECSNDAQCSNGRTCMAGKCRCRPGTVDHAGVCEPLEEIEVQERPVPISYARHRALSEPKLNVTHENSSPSFSPSEKPRIVGPPIRRPKPKNKGGSSGSGGGGIGNSGSGNYKVGGTGAGNCPPGNEPTRDDSGKLIMCNGLEPNCPPRSYCYITSGGFATEEYNCCKSW